MDKENFLKEIEAQIERNEKWLIKWNELFENATDKKSKALFERRINSEKFQLESNKNFREQIINSIKNK